MKIEHNNVLPVDYIKLGAMTVIAAAIIAGSSTAEMCGSEQGKQPEQGLRAIDKDVAHSVPTRTLLVGGGIYPREATAKFVEWAGGSTARILIITWGGGDRPNGEQGRYDRLKVELEREGVDDIMASPRAREMGKDSAIESVTKQISSATGIFFTGGDQEIIMNCIENCKLEKTLKQRHAGGVVFGGNSAGAAVMAESMMLATRFGDEFNSVNPNWIRFTPGLGMIKTGLVDQHFEERRRQNRMFAALAKSDLEWAIGVDEGNAVAIENESAATVFGKGAVWIVTRSQEDNSKYIVTLASEDRGRFEFRNPSSKK